MSETLHESYQVLARKYRPQTFEDMIGQEALVTTLTNAFKVGRVAHAFMLTGVRGIGKTTTARLLARALNFETDTIKAPSVSLGDAGIHCPSIMASTHMDVLEMDAASRTGVENMREMLDGVRYAPVSARYKVYIIDEVHMLSTGAFNALLKTLEEPPDHAKFIFATTEIRKVPITVLSRCQRFDLRRVEADVLAAHLRGITDKEGAHIDDEALALIARAAEGSVRDSLSLLDQAIVQENEVDGDVSADDVRNMLGLADRVRVLDLFAHAAKGDGKSALLEMRSQYADGADPAIVMRDLLDICHDVTRAKTLGDDADFDVAPDQITRMKALAEDLSTGQLTRIWQLLMKAHSDVRLAPVPLAAAEMALLGIAVAGQLPPPEMAAKLIEALRDGSINAAPAQTSEPPATTPSPQSPSGLAPSPTPPTAIAPVMSASTANGPMMSARPQAEGQAQPSNNPNRAIEINTLEDLVANLEKTDIGLASDIKRFIRPVNFSYRNFSFQIEDGASPSLTVNIKTALENLTGVSWNIVLRNDGGGDTLKSREKREREEQAAKDRAHPAFSHPLFKDAKLIEIRPSVTTFGSATIIEGNFRPAEVDDEIED